MEEIDFSNCQRNARTYNGANGSKIGIYCEPHLLIEVGASLLKPTNVS